MFASIIIYGVLSGSNGTNIYNTIANEEHTTIKTEEGNVILLTEQQYNCLIESMIRNR